MKLFFDRLADILLRLILLLEMSIVFPAAVYLSWAHTHDMALRHGFSIDEALVFTLFVEALLIVCELVVIFCATFGKRIHLSVYVGVGIAAFINLVGNVSSFWSVSKWGVALGASITLITAIAVWIFATALAHQDGDKKDKHKTRQANVRQSTTRQNQTMTPRHRQDKPLRRI